MHPLRPAYEVILTHAGNSVVLRADRLRELLNYDPATGLFRWRVTRCNGKVKAGTVAGAVNNNGYVTIGIDGKTRSAHRLAFLYMEGAMPPAEVDHINGDRADNRWCNLRHATRSQNQANIGAHRTNKTGVKGVSLSRNGNRFTAAIQTEGKQYHLGTFDTIEEAAAAYERAANDLHSSFARVA